jgi:MFS family permease
MNYTKTGYLMHDRGFDRDWLAVAAAAIGLMFSVGALTAYPFGVFMGPIGHEFGWTRGQMSAAITFGQISLVVSSLLWGVLLDRFGPRRILLFSVVGLGTGMTCLSRLTAPLWHLYVLFALVPVLAAAANPIGYTGVLVRRFQGRLGLALGLALMGVGLGAAILPALAQHFISSMGWRSAYLGLAITAVVIGLPASLLATRSTPGPVIRAVRVAAVPLLPYMRTRAFPLICCTFFLLGTAGTGVLTHLVPMMTDQGFSPATAAKMAGLVGISTVVSRALVGWLLDRVHAAYMVATVAIVSACICLLLVHGGGTSVYATVCILLGLIAGAEVDFISFLIRRYFGAAAFGRLYAMAFAAFVLGPGAVMIGYSFDHFHSYRPCLLLFAGLSVLASLLAFALPQYGQSETA